MTLMLRVLVLAALLSLNADAAVQAQGVLHIKVVLLDADRKPTAVPRHALLVSDNPASAPPRRIVTALDGTAELTLRPGSYTVESDRPVTFQGKAYQWTQMVDIAAGRDTVLELTAANAEVEPVTADTKSSAATSEDSASTILTQWQDSVVALWTPTAHASGFVIDTNGTIATNQRVVGTAKSVEVQLTPAVKVAATVLAADPARDVAVLWIDPTIAARLRPVPLGCSPPAKPTVVSGQQIFTIGAPLREEKGMLSGTVSRVEAHAIVSDLSLATGSSGGPVFTTGGGVVGITSVVDEKDERWRGDARVVPVADVCEIVRSAEDKRKDASPPNGTHLPVEPVRPFPVDALKNAVEGRAGRLSPYQMSSSDFDVAFITPVLTYGVNHQSEKPRDRDRGDAMRTPDPQPDFARALMDFSNWSEYVADYPPTLLVRVTPRLVEGFWTKVARGAAQTQGVSVPAIKHFKSGFSRMRAFCGDAEVTPIHPFTLEHRVSENDVIREGLYVFDPGALGPACASVRLVLYSEKEPEKGETRTVDPKLIEQLWQDFAPYRALSAEGI
jgi:S1-C subfamily serine protease